MLTVDNLKDLKGKKVYVRVDFNVVAILIPVGNGAT